MVLQTRWLLGEAELDDGSLDGRSAPPRHATDCEKQKRVTNGWGYVALPRSEKAASGSRGGLAVALATEAVQWWSYASHKARSLISGSASFDPRLCIPDPLISVK
jgi:hypothetical protein